MISLPVAIATILSVFAYTSANLGLKLKDSRIVGGIPIIIEKAPYHVSVRIYGIPKCGGSIISASTILTAAHCMVKRSPDSYSVLFGSSVVNRGQTISVQRFIIHPNYDKITDNFDVALLFLKSPIPFSKAAYAIPLTVEVPAPGTEAVVTGWGQLYENGPTSIFLQLVQISITEKTLCQEKFYNANITDAMLCAGAKNKDACFGDSGGALVADGTQVGIVSWGSGCARPNLPAIYTNIATVRPWIMENMEGDNPAEHNEATTVTSDFGTVTLK